MYSRARRLVVPDWVRIHEIVSFSRSDTKNIRSVSFRCAIEKIDTRGFPSRRVYSIAPPVLGAGRRLAHDDDRSPRAAATDANGEFLAVRPYETGDDPRRVHWRSSARTDDLMVRQFEAPRRGGAESCQRTVNVIHSVFAV